MSVSTQQFVQKTTGAGNQIEAAATWATNIHHTTATTHRLTHGTPGRRTHLGVDASGCLPQLIAASIRCAVTSFFNGDLKLRPELPREDSLPGNAIGARVSRRSCTPHDRVVNKGYERQVPKYQASDDQAPCSRVRLVLAAKKFTLCSNLSLIHI